MFEKRILISPFLETELEPMKSTNRSGEVFETILEHKTQQITLGDYSYWVFVGSTAGRKGLPNQDFAGVGQKNSPLKTKNTTACFCWSQMESVQKSFQKKLRDQL